jgi:hypothetical protein
MPFGKFTQGYDQVSDTPSSFNPEEEDEEGRFLQEKNNQVSLKTEKLNSAAIKQAILILTWLTVVCIALATIMTVIIRERRHAAIDDMCFEHSTYYSKSRTTSSFAHCTDSVH